MLGVAGGLRKTLRAVEKAFWGQIISASNPFSWRNGKGMLYEKGNLPPSPEINLEKL